MKLIIINGPNLNLLGKREPEIYGTTSFEDYFQKLKNMFSEISLEYFQSNHEGELIDKIQQCGDSYDGILLNAGGYTHTSVALADAVAAITAPLIEIHISNIYAREPFRHKSLISPYARAVVAGFGLESYKLAIQGLTEATQ